MKTTVRPGLVLKVNPNDCTEGWLSGAALPQPVLVKIVRKSPKGDALVTDKARYYSVKAACIVCGEQEAGRRRLEIMRIVYQYVMKQDFVNARRVFFEMNRLLL